jgi:hypothetical protein
MDARLFFRVIWRFRVITAIGVALAVLLAIFSFASLQWKHGSIHTQLRGKEKWVSTSTVLVTERRFPLGRSVLDDSASTAPTVTSTTPQAQPFAPSERFTELASIYAELATSDSVREYVRKDGPLDGTIQANALSTANSAPLPLISIAGVAATRQGAVTLARRASEGLRDYIEIQQRHNGIPKDARVVLSVIKEPRVSTAQLLQGRSKVLPIVVFLIVIFGVIGLEFVLENLRPRMRAVTGDPELPAVEDTRARLLA